MRTGILLPYDEHKTTIIVGYMEERHYVYIDAGTADSTATIRLSPARALDLASALEHAYHRHQAAIEARHE